MVATIMLVALPVSAHDGPERHPMGDEWRDHQAMVRAIQSEVEGVQRVVDSATSEIETIGRTAAETENVAKVALETIQQVREESEGILAHLIGGSALALLLTIAGFGVRGYKHISHVVDDIAQRITEKERPMPRFNELEVRERGIPGSTGYAVIDADDVDYVKELRETLRKIDSGEARGQVRIQLRAGNQEPVATGMDTYRNIDLAFDQLRKIHDNTQDGKVARIDDTGG
ncbi:MAG: hypothetical protein OXH68_20975 [Gammaproteobacteria bacterium]|nr:hypothetical protein [Gammaproteobacteria bacterium]